MPLRFRETMNGTVRSEEGPLAFHFTVTATSPTVRALGGWSPMRLTGTAEVAGHVRRAELLADSFLWIGVPFHRWLVYHVAFRDDKGSVWRFHGQKTVGVRKPLVGMTTLEGRLFRDGEEVGPATLHFRLRDLPRFLASWRF